MTLQLTRRAGIAGAALTCLLGGCASTPPASDHAPIVFVHGNGDNAALWMTTLWRWESNGWPRDRLVAVDLPRPTARDDNTAPQPGRSSAAENAQALADAVEEVMRRTGAAKVVLVGNSRGGYAIRHYVQFLGGNTKVDRVVLGGTPNHGVWANPGFRPNNEFNGAGPYLTALNAPKGADGAEVTPGVAWLTLRSDHNDKYAQPDGAWIGARGTATNVGFDGPALKGATNLVLPGRDHRETAFHAEAFAKTYEFITGRAPATTAIVPESQPVLDGRVTGLSTGGPSNLPLPGATVEIYSVDPATGARRGAALHHKTVVDGGRWGPFAAANDAYYEFVITSPGYAITHIYRSPFARSSAVIDLRPERPGEAGEDTKSLITLSRPRGYFGLPRDHIVFDGQSPPAGVAPGVAGVSTLKLALKSGEGRTVSADYESGAIHEHLAGRAWPAAENHVVILELTQ